MKTIIEPAKPYMKLLGLQKHRAEETYRLMHFVVQTEVDDGLLLLHNMTKEMVLLSKEEQPTTCGTWSMYRLLSTVPSRPTTA